MLGLVEATNAVFSASLPVLIKQSVAADIIAQVALRAAHAFAPLDMICIVACCGK